MRHCPLPTVHCRQQQGDGTMEVRAIASGIRVSPRKARLVCDAVRGKDIRTAMAILQFLPQKSAPIIARTLKSASANAENNYDLDPSVLYVKFIFADDGPQISGASSGRAGASTGSSSAAATSR